jgi:hypothetical protein
MPIQPKLYKVIHEYNDERVENRVGDIIAMADLYATLKRSEFCFFRTKPRAENETDKTRFHFAMKEANGWNIAENVVTQSVGMLTLWLCSGGIQNTELFSTHLHVVGEKAEAPETVLNGESPIEKLVIQRSESMLVEARLTEKFTQEAFEEIDRVDVFGGDLSF